MPKKKRAAWGTKKRAAEENAAAEAQAAADAAAVAENGHAAAAAKPGVGEAIDSIKGWLLPFDAAERKQILKAVGVFLR